MEANRLSSVGRVPESVFPQRHKKAGLAMADDRYGQFLPAKFSEIRLPLEEPWQPRRRSA
jgi:hypothetical protein